MRLTTKIVLVLPLLLGVVVGLLILSDVYRDRSLRATITKEVPMYAEWDVVAAPTSSRTVGKIGPTGGQPVLRVRFGKDFMAVQVRNAAGKDGWILGGDDVRVAQ